MDGIPPPRPHTHDDGENKIDLKFNTSTASVKSAPQIVVRLIRLQPPYLMGSCANFR